MPFARSAAADGMAPGPRPSSRTTRHAQSRPKASRTATRPASASLTLVVLNDPPYDTERSFNVLRLAQALARADDIRVQVFLLGDAVAGSGAGQTTSDGHYNVARMLAASSAPSQVRACILL